MRSDSSEKPADVGHQDGDLADLAAEAERAPVAKALGGQLGVDVASESLPDKVAIAKGPSHVGHGPRQHADLVATARGDRDLEIPLPDAPRLLGEVAQGSRDPARGQETAAEGEGEGQQPERGGAPRLPIDGVGVVALGHHHLHEPAEVAHLEGHGSAQVRIGSVGELELRLPIGIDVAGGAAHQVRVHAVLGGRARPRFPAQQQGALPGGEEHAAARRHVEGAEEAPEAVQREVHREHAAHLAPRVENGGGAGDPEAAPCVELVGLRPDQLARALGRREVRALAGPVAVVVGPAHGPAPLPPAAPRPPRGEYDPATDSSGSGRRGRPRRARLPRSGPRGPRSSPS